MGKDNETAGEAAGSVENLVKRVEDFGSRETRGNVPVVGVKVAAIGAGPDDGGETHGAGNGADTIVNVTIRRTHCVGGDTSDFLDGLAGPAELGNDLLIGQGGKGRVGPSVDRELVTAHILCLKHLGARNSTRADDKERRLDIGSIEIVEKIRGVWRWTIVKGQAPCRCGMSGNASAEIGGLTLVGASGNVRVARASSTCPPAVSLGRCVGKGSGICGIRTAYAKVSDVRQAQGSAYLQPLLRPPTEW